VLDTLAARGALFLHEVASASTLPDFAVRRALAELVAAGLVTSDGFAGLRAIVDTPGNGRRHAAGRWSRTTTMQITTAEEASAERRRDKAVEAYAWTLLRRYGVVFRRVLTREANAVPWREIVRVYRRLEARGEIRGGRFVSGMSGEQFALPDAVERLREVRRTPSGGRLITISAADPLNLTGIVTAGERIRSAGSSRIVYRDGVPVAALEGEFIRPLAEIAATSAADVTAALTSRRLPAVTSGFVG
jgi:ATP-dependent helicase Lhr and Lhr-like helicase